MLADDIRDWIEKARRMAATVRPTDLIGTIDLTTLSDLDSVDDITALCERARREKVAAVCVFPRFVPTAARLLKDCAVRVATVSVDFPHGQAPVSIEAEGVKIAVAAGADEVDIVIRRADAVARDFDRVADQISALVEASGDAHLKVILETCQLVDPDLIYDVSLLALEAGTDFVKTSTGKAESGATFEAVAAMCLAVRDHEARSGYKAGIKPSGGIRTPADAAMYASLAREIAGIEIGDAERFRLGASSLLDGLLAQ